MAQVLHNPLFLKLGVLLVVLIGTLVFALLVISHLRKQLVSNRQPPTRIAANDNAFTLAAYEGVIRKMKEQEKELELLRRKAREQANESASMSEAVLSNLGSGVLLFNTANLVRQANPAAKSLLGYQSVFGLHSRDIFRGVSHVRLPLSTPRAADSAESRIDWDAAGPAPLIAAINLCIKDGTLFRRVEADYQTPSGETRVLGITISAIRGAAGESLGAAGLLSDLTEITHLSQQMRLRENMAALGEMSAGIAHEFKNSLATISGYAQMLQKDSANSAAAQFAGKIAGETAALARIVNDFLHFAKPQGLQRTSIILRNMLQDCAREAGIAADLNGVPANIQVEADPTAMHQAFSNLARNSLEAADSGVAAKITVAASTADGTTTIHFADNGKGISPDQLPKVFIPFFTTKAEGTGLGLALVHRIVTEHGGAISVAAGGPGATFTITLPSAVSAGIDGGPTAKPE